MFTSVMILSLSCVPKVDLDWQQSISTHTELNESSKTRVYCTENWRGRRTPWDNGRFFRRSIREWSITSERCILFVFIKGVFCSFLFCSIVVRCRQLACIFPRLRCWMESLLSEKTCFRHVESLVTTITSFRVSKYILSFQRGFPRILHSNPTPATKQPYTYNILFYIIRGLIFIQQCYIICQPYN